MADIDVKASLWRLVEVGRIVLFLNGPYTGRRGAIVEIIDHKRVRLKAEKPLLHWSYWLIVQKDFSRWALISQRCFPSATTCCLPCKCHPYAHSN